MVVITISKCPASLRGDLSKWFLKSLKVFMLEQFRSESEKMSGTE